MAHKIANVEIEFFHRGDQDGDVILRQHLEEMMASMRSKPLIDHPHYHLLRTRVTKTDGGSTI
jgi:hypothetical protein